MRGAPASFHDYDPADKLEAHIQKLRERGRPLLCTEYMARTRNSTFETRTLSRRTLRPPPRGSRSPPCGPA